MTTFWILTALLTALALALVLPTLLKARPVATTTPSATTSAERTTLEILRDQAAQLDAELAAGQIDAQQHRLGREEIDRRALDEVDGVDRSNPMGATPSAALSVSSGRPWKTAAVMALGVPLLALGLYGRLGSPGAIDDPRSQAPASEQVTMAQVDAMVQQLAERMKQRPDDLEGWTLLARTYAAMQRFPEANQAYERASALAPNDAQLLADRADVLAVVQGQSTAGEPAKLIARALEIDPKNLKALALAGSVAYEAQDYGQAIAYWTQARDAAPAGSEFASGLARSIEEARSAGGAAPGTAGAGGAAPGTAGAGGAAPGTAGAGGASPSTAGTAVAAAPAAGKASGIAATSTDPAAAPSRVAGRVTLAPALLAQAAPSDTVFVFARAAEGPRMPLAILRRTVADLPLTFSLDDSLAMSPEMKLSKFPVVVVGARVSKSGNAMPSPGDLVGQVTGVKTGTDGLQITIDSVQP